MKSVRFVRVLCAIVISCINAKEAEIHSPNRRAASDIKAPGKTGGHKRVAT